MCRSRISPSIRLLAFLIFHGLVWASFLVIAGVMLAFRRRMIDHGAAATQQFAQDILPLLALFAISVTGLMLTASYTWMRGYAYDFLAVLHAITVIVTLLWLPFGKLFHIFQRPAQLGVSFYKDAGARGEQASCRRCGAGFAPQTDGRRSRAGRARAWLLLRARRWRSLPAGVSALPARAVRSRTRSVVATIPVDERQIIDRFGPHLSAMTGVRLSTSVEPDRLVKTHCCFCGQQCGIQLKVRDNEVIGFEPWEEFPFNRGMLCPKGVKRYLQGSHPDRLLTAVQRDPSAPGGFAPMPYDAAIARVASEIARLQAAHGPQSIGVLGGASLTTEKTYLLGKFARVCLKTPYIDYNGRLCMVSAGAANKKAFGIDRTTNPWADMIGAGVIWVAGSNVAECSPITTNYLWQAREQGATIIIQDPRITPVARTCDLYLPVKPGRDAALFAGVLQIMIERGWIDDAFIEAHTVGFDAVAAYCKQWTLARTADVTGVPARTLMRAAEMWATPTDRLPAPCARHRASFERRAKRARLDQPRARDRPHRPAALRLRHHRRAGQRAGRT